MARLLQIVLYSGLLAWAVATPVSLVAKSPDPEPGHAIAKRDLESTREDYRGIYWDDAYSQCTTDEFNILAESTRMALDVSSYGLNQEYDSPAWNRYFVKDWVTNPNYGWHVSQSILH